MIEVVKVLIGIVALILGIPLGIYLAKYTKDELKEGKKWFKILVFIGLIGGLIGLIIKNDTLLFTFFFIAVVTSQSLKKDIKINK